MTCALSLTFSFTEVLPIEKFSETLGIKSKKESERELYKSDKKK